MFIFCLGGVCGLGFCIQLSLASTYIRLYPYWIAEIVPKIVCQEGMLLLPLIYSRGFGLGQALRGNIRGPFYMG